MRSPLSLITNCGFLFAIACFLGAGAISYEGMHHLSTTSGLVNESQRTLKWISATEFDLSEMERCARGFAVTGDESLLPPYELSVERKEHDLSLLREGIRDLPDQKAIMTSLDPLLARHYAATTSFIRIRREFGATAASQVVQDNDSTRLLEQMEGLLGEMRTRENQRLELHSLEAGNTYSQTKWLVFSGTAGGFVLICGVFFLLNRRIMVLERSGDVLGSEHGLMRELINHIPEAIYVKDAKGRIKVANRALRKYLTGDERAPVEGKTLFDFAPQEIAEARDQDDQSAVRSRHAVVDRTERAGIREGDTHLYITTKVPLFNIQGECTNLLVIIHDVSKARRIEDELLQATAAMEAAGQAKTDFLANMSHEIRTPMNGILGMIELGLDTELTAQQREYLSLCKNSAQALQDLLNDILDYSRGEVGAIALEKTAFELNEVVSQVITPLTTRAGEKQLRLHWRAAEDVPRWLVGDPARLRQVLVNLVGNAIKFTERGEVTLEIKLESAKRDEAVVHFSIRDTGIGVPEGKRSEIFNAFAQADTSHTRRFGGIGLGLTIASRLVKLMEGRIWLENAENGGSIFHFTGIFGVSEPLLAHHSSLPNATSLTNLSVLVVDPDFTNRRVLEEMLLGWQMVPEMVSSGATALEVLWRAFREANPFPLVLMDARMPQMDGAELARLIKREPELEATRLVLLSSVPELANSQKAATLGFDAALPKPVRPPDLLDVIKRLFSTSSQGQSMERHGESGSAEAEPAAIPLKVLVAEDNPVNQAVAMAILSKRGHHLLCAKNGVEAVAIHEKEPLDIILMDIQMPEMDGYTAVRHIRKLEVTTGLHVPIIAVTAHAMKGDRERCLSSGMDAYISKPFSKEELVRLVESFEIVQSPSPRTQVADQAALPAPDVSSEALPATIPAELVISSREQLIRELGDAELVISLIDIFVQQVPILLSELDGALTARNAQLVERTAHMLKGSIGNFGAREATRLAELVEDAGRVGDIDEASKAATKLGEALKLVLPALSKLRC